MQQEDIPLDPSTLIRLGTIASVDLAAARCTVLYGNPDDEDDEDGGATTPPIRWLAGRAGKLRVWSVPSVGEEVLLLCPDGQIGNGVALCGLFNGVNKPPASTDMTLMEYQDGAKISYDPQGHALSAVLPAGGTALIEAPGGMTLRGPVAIDGDVSITGAVAASGDVTGSGVSLSGHRHGGVQAGGARTGGPV